MIHSTSSSPRRAAVVPPVAPLALQAWPNPFNPHVTLGLSLEVGDPFQLDVFDVSGRRVATLRHLASDSGISSVTWDGRNESGRQVGPGVYFLRLTHDGRSVTAKGVLLR